MLAFISFSNSGAHYTNKYILLQNQIYSNYNIACSCERNKLHFFYNLPRSIFSYTKNLLTSKPLHVRNNFLIYRKAGTVNKPSKKITINCPRPYTYLIIEDFRYNYVEVWSRRLSSGRTGVDKNTGLLTQELIYFLQKSTIHSMLHEDFTWVKKWQKKGLVW